MRIVTDPTEIASVDSSYARIAELAKTAGCQDWQCAAVIVSEDGTAVGEGVNSPPGGLESQRRCHCDKTLLHAKVSDRSCCVHAEQRAVMDALRKNPEKIRGSTLYYCRLGKDGCLAPSGEPWCTICSKMVLDAGISNFVLLKKEGYAVYGTEEYNALSYAFAG